MKKILAMVLSLTLVICSLPAGIIALAADDVVNPYANIGMTLVSNNFDNSATENVPSDTNGWLHTASTGEKETTSWYVNNNMIMLEAEGNNSDSAIEFVGGSPTDYSGAFIDLDDQFFGSGVLGTSDYAGLTQGLVVTEFDIKANGLMHLALLGTGSTSPSSIASSVGSSYILRADGTVGTSDVTYNQGEWGRVKVVSNLNEKNIATYYNGKLVSTDSISYGYGIKQLNSENYGLMFQASEGDIDFVIDNFNISYVNKTHLGTASFDNFEMPSYYSLDGAFVPTAYVPIFDKVNTVVSIVDGKSGNGDKAMKFAPNGDSNPNYRFYYQNKSYKGTTSGVFHGQFDIKLESNFKVTLSAGWGLGFSDEVFSSNGYAGSVTYNNTDWYHVDVVTDYNNKTLKVYLDGNVILTRSNPSALIPSEYFQLIVWGNENAGSNGVILDNITFDYYNLPAFAGIVGFKTANTETFKENSEIPSNATAVKLALTKAFGYVGNDDIYVTINGVETSVNVTANTDATLDIAFPAEIGAGSQVSVKVLRTAIDGTCIPTNNEITTTFTAGEDAYEGETGPVNPYAAMLVDELTIYPADGKYVYEEDNLTLKAYAPEGTTDVSFTFDGRAVADVICIDNMYYIDIPTTSIVNGEHTLMVEATVDGAKVSKESTFNFYSGQTILVYNTFDELTSTPSSSNSNVYTKSSYGPSDSTWTFNNNMIPSLDTGKDGKGNSLRFTNTVSGAYAGGQLALDPQFFGVTTLGADGYPGGISEGTFVTEFDMKVNTAGQLGFLGLGSSAVNGISTSEGVVQLSTESGNMGSLSVAHTTGKWSHVEIYTNYAEGIVSTVVDGKIICGDMTASYPFGNKELWGRYGLMFQAKNAIDFSIDNFVIRYSNVHKIGQSEFDAYAGPLYQLNDAFIPRAYAPALDNSTATISLSDGFEGGKALSIAPNGSGNPNYRFYYQNKTYKNATSGVLHTSFDAKLDAFMDVRICEGNGLDFGPSIFGADGKVGSVNYNTNEWYHIDSYTDWTNNTYDIYINDVLAISGTEIPFALLRQEYFQFIVFGNEQAKNGAVHLDNLCFNYYDAPLFTDEATLNASGDVVTVPMSTAYASLSASDITLKVNGVEKVVTDVKLADNDIKITLNEAIARNADAEVTIGKNAKLGTLAIQNKAYSAKYTAFGVTIDESDDFVCANVDFKYGNDDGAYLDETLIAEYTHILSENEVLSNAIVSITENGATATATPLLSVENNKLIISLSGLKAGSDYSVKITGVEDGNGATATEYSVNFSTVDFDLKADAPTVANGVAKAKVYSAYGAGKTVTIYAATYNDDNELTGVVLADANVSLATGQEISLELAKIGGNADKVFVWNEVVPLSKYVK